MSELDDYGRVKPIRGGSTRGKFVKGVSGNPGGKLLLPPELLAVCRAKAHIALLTATEILEDKNQRATDRLRAAELILDRGYGKPVQQTELAVWKMSPEARRDRLEELLKERGVELALPPIKMKLEEVVDGGA